MHDVPETIDHHDQDLVERFRTGDAAAFREIFERHWPGVYRLCHRLSRDEDTAEDLTQEVFIIALQKLHGFRGEARLSTWLHRIAVNRTIAWLRGRERRGEVSLEEAGQAGEIAGGPDPSRPAERLELREALWRAVEELPPKQKAVFLLRTGEELPFAEIAEIVGRSVGGTKANFHLAVRHLRRALGPFWEEGNKR